MPDRHSAGPLSGVRVIELAHVMAGPVCGLMLADMGAEVIKVERLPAGDGTRAFTPPEQGGESAAFMMLNRGKRGLALDFRTDEGLEIVHRLIADADVVIENFRVGTMERMGLGYEGLAAANPGLVYCQITGFGRTGPLADQGGFDLIAQGYTGLMSITGDAEGERPVKVGAPITDITAGILAAFGVATALFGRASSGRGRLVDTSLFEAGIAHTYWQSAIALATGDSPGPLGTAHPLAAPYQAFETADGWINVGASNQGTWRGLTRALARPELADDPRFAENAGRMKSLEELLGVLAPVFRTKVSDDWLARLAEEGVPAGPIASIGEMLVHPQTVTREMVVPVEHTRLGAVSAIGNPVKAGQPSLIGSRGAPLLGEHSEAILGEAGYSAEEIATLVGGGVVRSINPLDTQDRSS